MASIMSVIMGAYNIETQRSDFDVSVKSILTQTLQDIEFIICDDGSTDKTYEILCDYVNQDARIILLRNQKNLGLAATLNRCLEYAGSEFVARQDADDYSAPTRLSKQLEFLQKHREIHIVGSNVILFDEKKEWAKRRLIHYPAKRDFLFGVPFVHGSIVFRKSALQAVGFYKVAKETRRAEDYELLMRMYAYGFAGVNLQENLYYYQESLYNMQKRKYRFRLDEVRVRFYGFKQLQLMPMGYIYCIKPLIAGLIPAKLLIALKIRTKRFLISEDGLNE